jgi:transposase
MASIAAHCSRFWIILKSRQTTTARNAPCVPPPTYRKVTGGFRSTWGADLYAAVRSTVSTAARQGSHAFDSIRNALKPATA